LGNKGGTEGAGCLKLLGTKKGRRAKKKLEGGVVVSPLWPCLTWGEGGEFEKKKHASRAD